MQKSIPILLTIICVLTPAAHAVKVADITRLSGQRPNTLTGMGLVVGLKGSGDGGDYMPAIKPLAAMLAKFENHSTVKELANAQNVAIVSLAATIPSNGVRNGDRVDVYVMSNGAASSLRGGRLFVAPMQGPLPGSGLLALAEGPIVLEDPSSPLVGVIKGGVVMEADLPAHTIDQGRFTLILDDPSASWTVSSTIAKIINDAEGANGEILAIAVDAKNVEVTIPSIERDRPDSFISRVQRLPVSLLPTEARVQINERSATMIITGDVEISPVVISHAGLTITTLSPAPVPTPRAPIISSRELVAMDTTSQGGAKLQDLVNALDQLKVPAQDRITIIKELHRIGKLHGKLIIE